MHYKIVGDSSCDITKEMENEMNIELAPLTFTLNGEEFVDDETLDLDDYLKKIDESDEVPKSACPSIHTYLEKFEGPHDWLFGVTLSSELSGSYNSAVNAMHMFLEKFPEKKAHIFNSKAAASKEVLIALKIDELAKIGKKFEQIVDDVEQYIEQTKTLFVLDKVDTLEKNGRLSKMKATIIRVLNLKLILTTDKDGAIISATQARGSKKALKKLVDEMPKFGTISKDNLVAIAHCNAPERAQYVKELIENMYEFRDVIIVKTRGLSSTYANEGGVIVSF
jgi:DegV family protein with EDD domain